MQIGLANPACKSGLQIGLANPGYPVGDACDASLQKTTNECSPNN